MLMNGEIRIVCVCVCERERERERVCSFFTESTFVLGATEHGGKFAWGLCLHDCENMHQTPANKLETSIRNKLR
jgi:hypothetical protein